MNCDNVRKNSKRFDGLYEIERTLLKANFLDTPRGQISPQKSSRQLFECTETFLLQDEMLFYSSNGGWWPKSEFACRGRSHRRQTMARVEFSNFSRFSARNFSVVALVCIFHYFYNRILQFSRFVPEQQAKISKIFASKASKMAAVVT